MVIDKGSCRQSDVGKRCATPTSTRQSSFKPIKYFNMNEGVNSFSRGRLLSLDALRGLDMIYLTGITGVLISLPEISNNAFLNFLAGQCHHTEWHGFHALDLVFPLFIFMSGVSIPFALSKRMEEGYSRSKLSRHIFRRSLILFFLGLIYNRSLATGFSNFLYTGVLQRIAIAYFFSAIIVMNTDNRKPAIIGASLLVIYWLLMILVPVPGYGPGVITPEGNLHAWLDRLLLPGRLGNKIYDEDGLLQQISSVAVCLAGVSAGHWVRSSFSQNKKALGLIGAGVTCILVALVWDLSFPIIFRLWSSSYAMLTVGISLILFGIFYWLIDVKGYRKWTVPLVIVGMNSITIYLIARFFDFRIIVNVFVHGFIDQTGSFKPLIIALGVLGLQWWLLYILYKKKLFLKV